MNTHRMLVWSLVSVVAFQLNACTLDRDVSPELEIKNHSKEYSPGFTGYTSGYGGYGGYLNGFGPGFWNPRYVYYTGYGQGYSAGN